MIWLGEVRLVPCKLTVTDVINLIKASNNCYLLRLRTEHHQTENEANVVRGLLSKPSKMPKKNPHAMPQYSF